MPKNQYTFSGHYWVTITAVNRMDAEIMFDALMGDYCNSPWEIEFDEDYEVYSPDDPRPVREYED